MVIDIGIQQKDRKAVSDALIRILADTNLLYLKTRNYHWNVVGPFFKSLHVLFQELYEDLGSAADEIAERIRALGFYAPGSYAEYIAVSAIKEEMAQPDAMDMLRRLTLDYELLIRRTNEVKEVAESVSDDATVDLMVERLGGLGKFAWMLRSHLE